MSPVAGTTRYLCPLECGWHHDRPPFPDAWIPTDIATPIAPEAIQYMAGEMLRQDAERTETALREHLATHTTEQFVRTIQILRAEVARLSSEGGGRMPEPPPLAPDEERAILSPGWVQLPPGMEGQYSPEFIARMNQGRRPNEGAAP